MGGLINAKSAIKKMSLKTEKRKLTTIVPMTVLGVPVKLTNTKSNTAIIIPSNMGQAPWLETRCATEGSKNRITVNSVKTKRGYTVTMTITQNHLKYVGSAPLAIISGTPNTERG